MFAPAIQNCKRILHAAQLLLYLVNNTARTQILYIITSARNAAAIAKGMVELRVHSFLLKRRESTLAVRSEVLEMLEVKDDDSPKVKWMRRVYSRVDYTQAPWTVFMLRQPS